MPLPAVAASYSAAQGPLIENSVGYGRRGDTAASVFQRPRYRGQTQHAELLVHNVRYETERAQPQLMKYGLVDGGWKY